MHDNEGLIAVLNQAHRTRKHLRLRTASGVTYHGVVEGLRGRTVVELRLAFSDEVVCIAIQFIESVSLATD